jgi:hypothetical protein
MKTWAYLLIFNDAVGARKEVQEFLDTLSEVTYWYGCMPNSVFLTATVPAGTISDKIQARFGTGSGQRFFLTEVHPDRQGWMPKAVWHLLKDPSDPRLPDK